MKKIAALLVSLSFLLSACSSTDSLSQAYTESAVSTTSVSEATVPTTFPTLPETTAPPPEPVILLTEEEKNMLLKLGMAERGDTECTECIALVMRTVLNRVESNRFGSSIRSVIFAPEQFTPVMDGSYDSAEPNERCYEALDLIVYGWDESQGALFYEWCEGESWHSKNLHLLFQHCDVRFYD